MTKLYKCFFALLTTAAILAAVTGEAAAMCTNPTKCIPPHGKGSVAWHPGTVAHR